jgi:hypothetical protein
MGFNFPDAPTIGQAYTGYVWNGESWQVQGGPRSGLSSVKKNYIINGAMMISQENGTNVGTVNAYFPVDMFGVYVGGTSGVFNAQQVLSPTISGSPNRLRVTVATADAAVAPADIVWVNHAIEGYRAADLRFGNAAAKTVTLQFGVKAPAGTYSVVLGNNAFNRTYTADYVIAAGEANTDVIKSITIPGDTTGSWVADNGACLTIRFGLMAGTTYQQAPGAWGAVNAVGSTNQFNFMATVGNVFELFDVSLTEGTVAPSFTVPDYGSELAACKRYFQIMNGGLQTVGSNNGYYSVAWPFSVVMRAAPTVTFWVNIQSTGFAAPIFENISLDAMRLTAMCNAATGTQVGFQVVAKMNARL